MTGEQLNKTLTEARPSIRDIFRLQEESDIENYPAKNWNPKVEVERLAKWQNVDKYFKYCDDKQLSFVFVKKLKRSVPLKVLFIIILSESPQEIFVTCCMFVSNENVILSFYLVHNTQCQVLIA